MKLVIDIPEELTCEGFERPFTEEEKNILIKAIGNGTPLPKGHGRLIDAKAYEQDIRKHYFDNELVIRSTEIALSNAPTIIESEG